MSKISHKRFVKLICLYFAKFSVVSVHLLQSEIALLYMYLIWLKNESLREGGFLRKCSQKWSGMTYMYCRKRSLVGLVTLWSRPNIPLLIHCTCHSSISLPDSHSPCWIFQNLFKLMPRNCFTLNQHLEFFVA